MINIKFCGAAHTVTGSNYLVKTPTATFVVDCGMFQGPDVEHKNLEEFAYDPSQVDFVLLTHSHIDHSGMIPKLVAKGFTGPIYATNHTVQITTLLMLDSAKIQESNYKQGLPFGKFTKTRGYAYTTKDAQDAIGMFKSVAFDEEYHPANGITMKYITAGHILGAASIEMTIDDGDQTKKIVFSGDIGRENQHLIDTFDKEYKSEPDYVLMESLYGGITHPSRDDSVVELVDIINETLARGGNVFIPCFAVERTQEIINDLKNAKEKGILAEDVSVWLDSPLAQRVTQIYMSSLQSTEENLFDFPGLNYVNKFKQSLKLTKQSKQVILAGSGMADGGRIVTHLASGLENKKNSVVFVGFQAIGTLGRLLTEGEKKVQIGTKVTEVNAQIHHLQGFSAHGDTNDYMLWLKRFLNPNLKNIFLVHAEEDRAQDFKNYLADKGINNTVIPDMYQEYNI